MYACVMMAALQLLHVAIVVHTHLSCKRTSARMPHHDQPCYNNTTPLPDISGGISPRVTHTLPFFRFIMPCSR